MGLLSEVRQAVNDQISRHWMLRQMELTSDEVPEYRKELFKGTLRDYALSPLHVVKKSRKNGGFLILYEDHLVVCVTPIGKDGLMNHNETFATWEDPLCLPIVRIAYAAGLPIVDTRSMNSDQFLPGVLKAPSWGKNYVFYGDQPTYHSAREVIRHMQAHGATVIKNLPVVRQSYRAKWSHSQRSFEHVVRYGKKQYITHTQYLTDEDGPFWYLFVSSNVSAYVFVMRMVYTSEGVERRMYHRGTFIGSSTGHGIDDREADYWVAHSAIMYAYTQDKGETW